MCGIAGLWAPDLPDGTAQVAAMVRRLHHRGPDSSGLWSAPAAGPQLGQARLAIVDLSEHGHQPMHSASGRYTLTYNGEIYNHAELRRQLGPRVWRGHADTETLLAAIEHWGLEGTLQRAVGMFALALWDAEERSLTLARDRLGEKPLYLASLPRGLGFASELKALLSLPGVNLAVDATAVDLYLQRGVVPAPRTIHQGIRKLPPGHWVRFRQADERPATQPWWQLPAADLPRETGSDEDALAEFERLLSHSLQGQSIADVPLGAFLSGGVDSSLVTAMLQEQSRQPVRTFSIGFAESGYDESAQARAVARHLGTDHTELHVGPGDALALVPTLAGVWDEPFADASQIPTLLLARLTRQHVTVALSGDGGDELFGGYNRHLAAARLWPRVSGWPLVLRRPLAATLAAVPARTWDAVGSGLNRLRTGTTPSALGEKLHKLGRLVGARDAAEAYRAALVHWPDTAALRGRPVDPMPLSPATAPTLAEQMMHWDLQGYLPDDILVKVDRAAMRHSLETRVPLLDHRLVEFACRQPLSRKIRGGQSKWLMRQALYRRVPQALIERPKQGFSLPLDSWLRGPLRAWADELLDPATLKAQGWLQAATVRSTWQQHLSGQNNHAQALWTVLMFQAWLQQAGHPPVP